MPSVLNWPAQVGSELFSSRSFGFFHIYCVKCFVNILIENLSLFLRQCLHAPVLYIKRGVVNNELWGALRYKALRKIGTFSCNMITFVIHDNEGGDILDKWCTVIRPVEKYFSNTYANNFVVFSVKGRSSVKNPVA